MNFPIESLTYAGGDREEISLSFSSDTLTTAEEEEILRLRRRLVGTFPAVIPHGMGEELFYSEKCGVCDVPTRAPGLRLMVIYGHEVLSSRPCAFAAAISYRAGNMNRQLYSAILSVTDAQWSSILDALRVTRPRHLLSLSLPQNEASPDGLAQLWQHCRAGHAVLWNTPIPEQTLYSGSYPTVAPLLKATKVHPTMESEQAEKQLSLFRKMELWGSKCISRIDGLHAQYILGKWTGCSPCVMCREGGSDTLVDPLKHSSCDFHSEESTC